MRILFLGNNWLGWKILSWLKDQGEEIVGLLIHSPKKQKYGQDILKTADIPESKIFYGTQLKDPKTIKAIADLSPDIGVSILFDYILKEEFIGIFQKGIINLHPSYLPYNRGQYPNVWSIIDKTPAGVSLHYIDAGIDTGDIISRHQIPVEPIDTGESLYRKLEIEAVALFKESWPLIRSSTAPRKNQKKSPATYHRTQDTDEIDLIDLDRKYLARELIDILRARTFPPYHGAYYYEGGRKICLRLQLYYHDSQDEKMT